MDASNPHGALLTIDVAALVANWRLLAARAAPGECAAVVKADGYGLGIAVVVPALAQAGAAPSSSRISRKASARGRPLRQQRSTS